MNRRNKEFAEEVKELYCAILEALDYSYDNEANFEVIIQKHMRDRMIATRDCAMRHFDNLRNRDLFILVKETYGTGIKLNPKMEGQEIDLLIAKVKMPSKPLQTSPNTQP